MSKSYLSTRLSSFLLTFLHVLQPVLDLVWCRREGPAPELAMGKVVAEHRNKSVVYEQSRGKLRGNYFRDKTDWLGGYCE